MIASFFLAACAATVQISPAAEQDVNVPGKGVTEFVEVALGLDHLTEFEWARGCEYIERVAAGLSEEELLGLFAHAEAVVRAAALVGAYVDGRTQMLPQTFARLDDDGLAQPRRRSNSVAILPAPDGTYKPSGPAYEDMPQTVGDVARAIITHHFISANLDFQVPAYDRTPKKPHGFATYWLERNHRQHCLSWLRLALGRATRGCSARDAATLERVAAVRSRMDAIERPYGAWVLLALSKSRAQIDNASGDDLIVDERDLVAAGQAIGETALMRFLAGTAPAVSDPDCTLGPRSRFPYGRIATFILRHAPELLPNTSIDALLVLERRHLAKEPVGEAPQFRTSQWTIAAADLEPERATPILLEGFKRYAASNSPDEQDQRAYLALALWRHAGERQLDFILDWFFAETPELNGHGFGRQRIALACPDDGFRPL